MAKFSSFLNTQVIHRGMTAATFQLPLATKERIDQIATTLNKSSAEVYRTLVEASLPDLEAEVEAFIDTRKKARK